MTFKAKDYTKYFEKTFENRIGYPTTARLLAEDVCDQCGVSLNDDSFINEDFVIESNQFVNNEKCRDVLKAISMLSYSWCRIGFDNEVHFDFNSHEELNTFNTIDNDHYYDLKTSGSKLDSINKVVIGMKDIDGENVSVTKDGTEGDNELDIWDNPLTYTQELRELAIENANILFDTEYTAIESTTTGHPWLNGNEYIRFVDMESNNIDTIPLDRTISYSGHIKTKIVATAISKTNTTYTYESKIISAIKNTQIKVDKAEQQITSLVTQTEEINNTVAEIGTTVTQTLDNFQVNITQIQTQVDENKQQFQDDIDDINGTLEEGVTKLKNTLVTINANGIQVATNLSKISTIMTNDTFAITDDSGTKLAYFGYDETEGRSVSQMDNLTITNYFTAGVHRVEKYEVNGKQRTGWFYVGGDY